MNNDHLGRYDKEREYPSILTEAGMKLAQEVCQLDSRFWIETSRVADSIHYLRIPPELSKRDYVSLRYFLWGGTDSAFLRKLRARKAARVPEKAEKEGAELMMTNDDLPVFLTDDPRLGKPARYAIDGFTGKIGSILRSSDGQETICIDSEPGCGPCADGKDVEMLEQAEAPKEEGAR